MNNTDNHSALIYYLDDPVEMFKYLTWLIQIRKPLPQSNVIRLRGESVQRRVLEHKEQFIKRKIFRNRFPSNSGENK